MNSSQTNSLSARVLLLVVGGVLALSSLGCCAVCYRPVEFSEQRRRAFPKLISDSQAQLQAAVGSGEWTPEQEQLFLANVSHLPVKEHLNLSRQLAMLINTKRIRVRRTEQAEPHCPCIPATCANSAPKQPGDGGGGGTNPPLLTPPLTNPPLNRPPVTAPPTRGAPVPRPTP